MLQDYPRSEEGLLDEIRLALHTCKIAFDELKAIIAVNRGERVRAIVVNDRQGRRSSKRRVD